MCAQAQLSNLTAAARIIRSHQAVGPAKQILPDSAFLVKQPLQQVFQQCTRVANERNANRKATSLKGLVTSDGRRVEFSREARDMIPKAVEQLIRCIADVKQRTLCFACLCVSVGLSHRVRYTRQHLYQTAFLCELDQN